MAVYWSAGRGVCRWSWEVNQVNWESVSDGGENDKGVEEWFEYGFEGGRHGDSEVEVSRLNMGVGMNVGLELFEKSCNLGI